MENLWMPHEAAAVQQMMAYTFIGGPATVQSALQAFVEQYRLDEVMIVSHIYDHEARMKSYKIVGDGF
jgi:alkanesulfonate monooxygenase SsuD/methylene tetrahydromethanopterin reductase-like flavin-dependent oxidoreductase (luciferase family)